MQSILRSDKEVIKDLRIKHTYVNDENQCWKFYEATLQTGDKLVSWFLCDENEEITYDVLINKIRKFISPTGQEWKVPRLSNMSKDLGKLIWDCYLSDNDILFIEKDDENIAEKLRTDKEYLNKLIAEVESFGLSECICIDTREEFKDDPLITVYFNVITAVNFDEFCGGTR